MSSPEPIDAESGGRKLRYLKGTELFRDFTRAQLEPFHHTIRMETCPAGHVFYRPGETGEVMFLLKEGGAHLYRLAADGRKFVFADVPPSSTFGEMACLFDGQGNLVKRSVGEGSYHEIEFEIRRLLAAADPGVRLPPVSHEATVFAKTGQPSYAGITGETYLGADRRERGTVTLDGDWRSERQYLELRKGTGKIVLPFTAGEVNLVMQPGPSGSASVTVLLDGKPVGDLRGADVDSDGVARFDGPRMIRLVAGAARRRHVLTLVTSDLGVRAFAFTFGP